MTDDTKTLSEVIDGITELVSQARPASSSVITVQAGGVGLWVSVTACVVMLFMNVALLFTVLDHSRKIDRLEDYLQAAYRSVYQPEPHQETQ